MADSSHSWKAVYRLGGAAAILTIIAGIVEILVTNLPDGGISSSGLSVNGWFEVFNRNPLMGMRNLGLINIFLNLFSVFIVFALFGAHREVSEGTAGLALVLTVIGLAVFFATNRAFSMLELSTLYKSASGAADKNVLEAAGRAMLAAGRSHSPGTFIAFSLGEIAGIIMSVVMLRGGVFGKITSILGIIGYSSLLVFEILTSFVLGLSQITMIPALAGGLSILAWDVLVSIKFFRLGRL